MNKFFEVGQLVRVINYPEKRYSGRIGVVSRVIAEVDSPFDYYLVILETAEDSGRADFLVYRSEVTAYSAVLV